MMGNSRVERLAVLRDRKDRGASEPADLHEALTLATEAHHEAGEAQRRLIEMEGLRSLMSAADSAIRDSVTTTRETEKYLAAIAQAKETQARFYAALSTPKVLVPLGFLILVIIGSLIGALTIEPVSLRLPNPLDFPQ